MSDPVILHADVGSRISVIVPNWSVTGFTWEPSYDKLKLRMAGRVSEPSKGTSFHFDVLATDAELRLELRRSGQVARETRRFVVRGHQRP